MRLADFFFWETLFPPPSYLALLISVSELQNEAAGQSWVFMGQYWS